MKTGCFSKFVLAALTLLCPWTAQAQAPIVAQAVEVTESAVWFSRASHPDVVYYFPFASCQVERELQFPNSKQRYRVFSALGKVDYPEDLGEIRPEWAGRVAAPYRVTGTQSCTLEKGENMSQVVQQIELADRVLDGGNDGLSLCQWSFNLPEDTPVAQSEQITREILDGTRFSVPLKLSFALKSPQAWKNLYVKLTTSDGLTSAGKVQGALEHKILMAMIFTPEFCGSALPWWNHEDMDALIELVRDTYFVKELGIMRLRRTMPEGFEYELPALPSTEFDVGSCGVRQLELSVPTQTPGA